MSDELDEKLSELTILQQSVEEQKAKAAEYFDQLLRLRAEFDNYRKRVEKEKVEARQWGKQEVLMPLLSLVDVFEQAMVQAQNAKDVKQVAVGLEFLHKNFSSFLKSEGLAPIEVVGKAFDPQFAEALLNMGHAQMALGAEDKALASWRRAIKEKPSLADSYFEPLT